MGKPGSPWQGGPWPSRTTWLLSTELLGPGCPCSPTCHCVVWAGLCLRGIGASHGKAAPCPGWWGHGAPHKMRPRGAVQGSVCAHLLWTWPTPSSAHTHKLTCAHTFVCTPVYARAVCLCICMPMYIYAHTRSCTCDHMCTHVCTHMLTAHAHHVWACSYALVHSCALTHSSAHVPTHTPSRAALHAHAQLHCVYTNIAHPHPHMYILTPTVAPGPIPPCQAQAQPTHCETNTGAQGPLGVRLHGVPPGKSWGREQREPPGTVATPQDTHAATT